MTWEIVRKVVRSTKKPQTAWDGMVGKFDWKAPITDDAERQRHDEEFDINDYDSDYRPTNRIEEVAAPSLCGERGHTERNEARPSRALPAPLPAE